jgi:hypothetical protein
MGRRKLSSRIRSIVRRARSRARVFRTRRRTPGLSVFQYDSLKPGEIRVLSFEKQDDTKAPVRLTIGHIARESSINENGELGGKSERLATSTLLLSRFDHILILWQPQDQAISHHLTPGAKDLKIDLLSSMAVSSMSARRSRVRCGTFDGTGKLGRQILFGLTLSVLINQIM